MLTRVWALHPFLKLQLLCSFTIIPELIIFIGKILNNVCQGALNAVTINSDTVVSPAAAIVFYINLLLLSMVEVVLEIYIPRERIPEDD